MTTRRIIKGVLHNFLGTFTSRDSDLDGYWVFGFLVDGLDGEKIDLLDANPESSDGTPLTFARRLAVQKFAEQIVKANLSRSWFREARLEIAKLPGPRFGVVNGRRRYGNDIRFLANAVTDLGRTYESTLSIFVTPHDPNIERRSARAV